MPVGKNILHSPTTVNLNLAYLLASALPYIGDNWFDVLSAFDDPEGPTDLLSTQLDIFYEKYDHIWFEPLLHLQQLLEPPHRAQ